MTIFLCGFMGCGKSTIGKTLAEKLQSAFTDLDEQIEKAAGMTIAEIFADKGERHFRTLETSAIRDIKVGIAALGGGAIINPENAAIINKLGISIFIDTDFDTCYQRIKHDNNRPIAREKSRKELEQLYNTRKQIYLENSQFTVDGNTDIDTISERIISLLNGNI